VLAGHSVAGLSDAELARIRNQQLGFVFQNFNLLPRYSARQNVELPLIYAGLSPRERHQRAVEALEQVGLGDRINNRPNELSGGQKQRVAIARAIVNRPTILMADEPTGALDTRTSEEILQVFQHLHKAGLTLMMVTHEPDVAACCQRILQMQDGRLIDDRPIEQRSLI
jgi:putative ABC transport system ATP-binding protein